MSQRQIVICNPVRTAIGTFGGALKDTPVPDLGAAGIRETLKRSGLAAEEINTVVMGNVIQAGTKMNPARQAAIGAGLPVRVPAMTLNRCAARARNRSRARPSRSSPATHRVPSPCAECKRGAGQLTS
jgi:acetyl-CoA acetyltransferase